MKITLLGYGKMGKEIESAAKKRGHTLITKLNKQTPIHHLTKEELKQTDVFIDFSNAACTLSHVSFAAKHGINLVMGTTGWEEVRKQIEDTLHKNPIGFFFAPNFSVGVNLFIKIVEEASKTMHGHGFDVGIIEEHHKQKQDSPSGTAKALKNTILTHFTEQSDLSIGALRCGAIPGTHSVIWSSTADTITLTHQAHSREGFANGSIDAAEWLIGKKGFFTMNNLLEDLWKK